MSESLATVEAIPFYKRKVVIISSSLVLAFLLITASVYYLVIFPKLDKKIYSQDGTLLYIGQTSKQMKDGEGTSFYPNGTPQYTGDWSKDQMSGNGSLYYEDGTVKYNGSWLNNQMHGIGSLYYENGNLKYSGTWSNNDMHGNGTLYDQEGNVEFEGIFETSKPYTGKGTLKNSSNEVVYIGELKEGLKDGSGKLLSASNITYDGEWLADKYHGKGKLVTDKDKYEGMFEQGIRHGEGKSFSLDDKLLFEGEWQNDIFQTGKSGDGLILYENGKVTNLIPARIGDQYAYLDLHGNIVIERQFTYANSFVDGLASVTIGSNKDRSIGFIDYDGKYVITPQFDYTTDFMNGYAVVMLEDPATIERCQTVFGEYSCNDFYEYYDQYQDYLMGYMYGVIDKTGKIIIPIEYNQINYDWENEEIFSEGLLAVGKYSDDQALFGYMDVNGQYVINPQFNFASYFKEGYAVVGMYDDDMDQVNYGVIDKNGKIVIPLIYQSIETYSDGLFGVTNEDGKYGYIDHTGKYVIKPIFDYGFQFVNGKARVSQSGKLGFIDKTGKYIINPQYSHLTDFSEGLASVCNDKYKCGFINESNQLVINYQFDYSYAYEFIDGHAIVTVSGKTGIINKEGKFIVNPTYEYIDNIHNGVFIGIKKGKYGLANLADEVIIPFHYDYLSW